MVFQLFYRRTFRRQRSLHFHIEVFPNDLIFPPCPLSERWFYEFFVMAPCCTRLLPEESSVATRMPEESQDLKLVMWWDSVQIQWLESWDHVTSTSCRHGSWPGGTCELRKHSYCRVKDSFISKDLGQNATYHDTTCELQKTCTKTQTWKILKPLEKPRQQQKGVSWWGTYKTLLKLITRSTRSVDVGASHNSDTSPNLAPNQRWPCRHMSNNHSSTGCDQPRERPPDQSSTRQTSPREVSLFRPIWKDVCIWYSMSAKWDTNESSK